MLAIVRPRAGSQGGEQVGADAERLRPLLADDVSFYGPLAEIHGAEPTPVASWIHVERGEIGCVRVTFDPRGMLSASR